jgi:hypothetical protein
MTTRILGQESELSRAVSVLPYKRQSHQMHIYTILPTQQRRANDCKLLRYFSQVVVMFMPVRRPSILGRSTQVIQLLLQTQNFSLQSLEDKVKTCQNIQMPRTDRFLPQVQRCVLVAQRQAYKYNQQCLTSYDRQFPYHLPLNLFPQLTDALIFRS